MTEVWTIHCMGLPSDTKAFRSKEKATEYAMSLASVYEKNNFDKVKNHEEIDMSYMNTKYMVYIWIPIELGIVHAMRIERKIIVD